MTCAACSTGDIADVLYGASLLPSLERLHMVGQGFYGTLPSNIQFPTLYHINLGYNYLTVRPITVSPPPAWWHAAHWHAAHGPC